MTTQYKVLLKVGIFSLVLVHYIVFLAIISAPAVALLLGDYVLVPVTILFIFWKVKMTIRCPLSVAEGYLEEKLGTRPHYRFMASWIISSKRIHKNLVEIYTA
jgi:hypothetical protein